MAYIDKLIWFSPSYSIKKEVTFRYFSIETKCSEVMSELMCSLTGEEISLGDILAFSRCFLKSFTLFLIDPATGDGKETLLSLYPLFLTFFFL